MGFLGGGFFGSGASETTNTTNVTTFNQQLSGGDLNGSALGLQNSSGNEINFQTSDFGAIHAAADISQHALDLGASALSNNTTVALYGIDNASKQLESSLNFAGANDAGVFNVTNHALENANDLAKAFGVYSQNLAETAVSGNAALASQVSQSSGQTVADSLVKIATIAGIAVVAFYLFKS